MSDILVFVTGANRGIGLGLAQHYLKAGAQVIATARKPDDVAAFQSLRAKFGDQFIPLALEVTDTESINQLAEQVATLNVRLDLLINNAAISIEENFGQWTLEHFKSHFAVNAIGPALLTQALIPFMREGGKVINLSSGMASLDININPDNGYDAYAMSKAALNMMTLRLAEKLKPKSITAVTISPGWVQTEMGGPGATTPVEEAVASVTKAILRFTLEQSGGFFSETGEALAW